MKIATNSSNVHVFRVNRPAIKNKQQSPFQDNDSERISTCSRTSLSAETKRLICEYHINNPKCTQESLAVKFGCKRSTIAKIIKSKERWLSINADAATAKRFRQRNSRFPLVENALKLWLQEEQDNLADVTDQMIRCQARQYAQAFSIEDDFKASSSWINNFKQRYNVDKSLPIQAREKATEKQHDFIIESDYHSVVKKFTNVFAVNSPEEIPDHTISPEDSISDSTPLPNYTSHIVENQSPSFSPSTAITHLQDEPHTIPNDPINENELLVQGGHTDMPLDDNLSDYTDTCDDPYTSPASDHDFTTFQDSITTNNEPNEVSPRDTTTKTNSMFKDNTTKLHAKRHLEAALAFYTSQSEGGSSMSASMIKLILQNDFI